MNVSEHVKDLHRPIAFSICFSATERINKIKYSIFDNKNHQTT